jgi:hypothetical protein
MTVMTDLLNSTQDLLAKGRQTVCSSATLQRSEAGSAYSNQYTKWYKTSHLHQHMTAAASITPTFSHLLETLDTSKRKEKHNSTTNTESYN